MPSKFRWHPLTGAVDTSWIRRPLGRDCPEDNAGKTEFGATTNGISRFILDHLGGKKDNPAFAGMVYVECGFLDITGRAKKGFMVVGANRARSPEELCKKAIPDHGQLVHVNPEWKGWTLAVGDWVELEVWSLSERGKDPTHVEQGTRPLRRAFLLLLDQIFVFPS